MAQQAIWTVCDRLETACERLCLLTPMQHLLLTYQDEFPTHSVTTWKRTIWSNNRSSKKPLSPVLGIAHHYVYGQNVIVESDDKPLESITHKPLAAAPSRLEIMILQLQRYDFIITHRPGKETQYLLLTHYQGSCCQKKEAVSVKVYSSAYSIQQLTSQWQDFTKSLWSRPLTHVDKGWMSWGEEMW